jgi:hypothetical protein
MVSGIQNQRYLSCDTVLLGVRYVTVTLSAQCHQLTHIPYFSDKRDQKGMNIKKWWFAEKIKINKKILDFS